MGLTDGIKGLLKRTADRLAGAARRLFMADAVETLGEGGQRLAETELGWNRGTIRKGAHELESGIQCLDAFELRGRKPTEDRLPKLLDDIRSVVDGQSQTDPTFRTTRIYRRMTSGEVRRQLIAQKGYQEDELPQEEAIRRRLDDMGYCPSQVQKVKPKKRIPETDAIFEHLKIEHKEADEDPTVLRVSFDVKATVPVGEFSRGGKSRVKTKALDHDFKPDEHVTPVGLVVPKTGELFLYMVVGSKVTSDCLVDIVNQWWSEHACRYPGVTTLAFDQDNGPENNSHRTQFVKRMVEFADKHQVDIRLLYYPPYHSKYNPIERCFGALEKYWNGSLLDSVEAVRRTAEGMTWKGLHPVVKEIHTVYETGVSLTRKAMATIEQRLDRLPRLGKWFVGICCAPPAV